ncbi:MAG TPA: type II toxin-antitoxin system RelE/ParE family toxin [Rhodoblastus sp.]|nr:type II toxin-antitoxin system RelE/ParE family toxin [Rhodoblastus sp.]
MRAVFTPAAVRDLGELRRYLTPLSPEGLASVTRAIERRIQAALDFPASGRPSPHPEVREIVEPHYGFLIPYAVRSESLIVLRIYRSARKPLDYEALARSLPRDP